MFHEDGESSMNILSGENERIGDIELGVMPITNEESPIRGIIKSTSQVFCCIVLSILKLFKGQNFDCISIAYLKQLRFRSDFDQ